MPAKLEKPAVIVADADAVYAAQVAAAFRQRGWDVRLAVNSAETRELARRLPTATVVLDAELPDESGWLTCDKLTRELPGVRVLLVASDLTPEQDRLAAFVGATDLIERRAGVRALVTEVCGAPLHAVG